MSAPVSLRAALIASLVVAGLLLSVPPASAVPKCFGKTATIVGTGKGEIIEGTPSDDVIVGQGGPDVIGGLGGNDRICGGGGKDELFGGFRNDKINGGAGADLLAGEGGKDVAIGGDDSDLAYGGAKADVMKGGRGEDILLGNKGNDSIRGGPGNDEVLGQQDNDTLNGGGGFDMASFYFSKNTAGIQASLVTGTASGEGADTLKSIENLQASGKVNAPDQLIGNGAWNDFWPHGGDDMIEGGGGNDFVGFLLSNDPVQVDLEMGVATGEGNDSLSSIESIGGSNFADTLSGNAAKNFLFSLGGGDSLFGLDGDDILHGGKGIDDGDGGEGNDECISIENDINCETLNMRAALSLRPGSAAGMTTSRFDRSLADAPTYVARERSAR